MINSGMFRHKIIIQNKKSVTDDIGQQINRWVDYFNCYAYVSNLSGREFWEAKQQHEENTTEFIIRYCKAISALNSTDFRIIFRNQIYDITFIDNIKYTDRTLKIKGGVHIET